MEAGVAEVVRDVRVQDSRTRTAGGSGATTGSTASRSGAADEIRTRNELYGRLHSELQRPARAMVRRAFGNKFSDAEIEDIYGNAWVGTLRALRNRPALSELELRKYVLTAVANHASKELRRRGRRPTSPLDSAPEVVDHQATPDEQAAIREQSQITREILATLPERRRAVLMFRYAWGLKPEEVCGLIKGLSHRAYRKEITRGVDEVVQKLRLVEQGRWCADREPLIKAFASGEADREQRRQAERHIAHCRQCAQFAGELGNRLHEIGSAVALSGAGLLLPDGRLQISERVSSAFERLRDALSGSRESGEQVAAQMVSSGGTRGAGATGAGVIAKVGLFGGTPKLAAVCLGTGAAATACVAAGVVPGLELPGSEERRASMVRGVDGRERGETVSHLPPPETLPSQIDGELSTPPQDGGSDPAPEPPPAPEASPSPVPAPTPAPQAPAPAQFEPTVPQSASSGGGGAPASGSEGAQEFGP